MVSKSKNLVRWSISSSLIGDNHKIFDKLVSAIYSLINDPDCNKPFESFQRYEL